jgi:segregation and condensation protein B
VADITAMIESLLFVADGPVQVVDLARVVDADKSTMEQALVELGASLNGRGVRIQRDNGHVQMVSAPESANLVQRFLGLEASAKLSKPALETLAIVAYEQPVTRPEIEQLRGVNCDGVLRTLIGRGLVDEVGRRDTVGLPLEYATTFQFLEYFGLASLDALPPARDFPEMVAAGASSGPADDIAGGEAIVSDAVDAEPVPGQTVVVSVNGEPCTEDA